MGANKLKQSTFARQLKSACRTDITLLVWSLAAFAPSAFGNEFDSDKDERDEVTGYSTETTGTDDVPAPEEQTNTTTKPSWLGFGREAFKPGGFSDRTNASFLPERSDAPLGSGAGLSRSGSSRLENNASTTAFFNTGGFQERGLYEIVPGWSFTPGFEARETYTDNVALRAENGTVPRGAPLDAQEDFVSELNPSIRLFGNQRRIKFQLRYLAQSLIYANNPDLTDIRHRLFSAAETELIPQLFYFDGFTSITQQNTFTTGRGVTSNFGAGSLLGGVGDNINFVGDRTDLLTYNLSPYLRTRLRNIALVELRYQYSDLSPIGSSDDNQISFGGTSSRGYRALVESGPMFSRLQWRLGYDRRSTNFSSGRVLDSTQGSATATFEKYFGQLEYFLVPKFSVLGTVGYENNDFAQSARFRDPPRGVIWDVGGRWAPTSRTNLQATFGQRFYGDRYFFDLTHRLQRTLFTINYAEEPTLGSLTGLSAVGDTNGGASNDITTPGDLCSQSVYVRKRLLAGMTYTGLRDNFSVQFHREERNYRNPEGDTCRAVNVQNQSGDQNLLGVVGLWTHALTPLSTLDAGVSWTDLGDGRGAGSFLNGSGHIWNFNLNVGHRISPYLSAFLGFRRIERISDDPGQEYTENRVFGSLRVNY